jgi:O-antigen/teichoic acid export membrane protein
MAFCSKCGTQVLSEAAFCGSCGVAVGDTIPPIVHTPAITVNSLDKKLHITLISAASIAVVLLYTTMAFPLIGIATGLSFGLSLRLFINHKKNNFKGTKKLDWILLAAFSTIAFILMFTKNYDIQALLLIFVAVRSLIMYFTMSND